jgi:hypothetical protein
MPVPTSTPPKLEKKTITQMVIVKFNNDGTEEQQEKYVREILAKYMKENGLCMQEIKFTDENGKPTNDFNTSKFGCPHRK